MKRTDHKLPIQKIPPTFFMDIKMNLVIIIIIILAVLFGFFYSYSQTGIKPSVQKIIIIRHGEKPDKGDNLSCQGLNRSLQLATVLNKKFGIPDRIYVPSLNQGKSTSTSRMYQTIVPYAVKYNLHINTKFDVKDASAIADVIKKDGGTVLLVWEHKAIIKIAKSLGIKDQNLDWDDSDFDSIWVISYKNGEPVLTRDKENIKPSSDCPH